MTTKQTVVPSYDKYSSILNTKGITSYQVSKDTGIAQSTLSDWKSGISHPKVDKLITIADYLGTTINELLESV